MYYDIYCLKIFIKQCFRCTTLDFNFWVFLMNRCTETWIDDKSVQRQPPHCAYICDSCHHFCMKFQQHSTVVFQICQVRDLCPTHRSTMPPRTWTRLCCWGNVISMHHEWLQKGPNIVDVGLLTVTPSKSSNITHDTHEYLPSIKTRLKISP